MKFGGTLPAGIYTIQALITEKGNPVIYPISARVILLGGISR
jgi:hypothetical protein